MCNILYYRHFNSIDYWQFDKKHSMCKLVMKASLEKLQQIIHNFLLLHEVFIHKFHNETNIKQYSGHGLLSILK